MRLLKTLDRLDLRQVARTGPRNPVLRGLLNVLLMAVFVALISLAAVRVANHLQTPQFSSDDINWGLMDYQNTVFYPVSALLDGVNPYDYERYTANYPVDASFPLYSPLILLIHLPLGMMPFGVSNAVYFLLNTILMLVTGALILHVCRVQLSLSTVLFMGILMTLSRPGWMVLLGGQIVCEVTIGTILALHYSRSRPVVSGLGLALACLKPTFGVPLAWMMLFRRDFRAVIVGGAISVCSIPLVIAILPGSDNAVIDFFAVIWNQHVASDNVLGVPDPSYHMRIDTLSVVSRIFSWTPGTTAMLGVFLVFLLTFGLVVRRFSAVCEKISAGFLDSVIICIVVLCSIYHMEYDALVLFLVIMILLTSERQRYKKISRILWTGTSLAVLLFLFNPFTTKSAQHGLSMTDHAIDVVGIVDGLILLSVLASASAVALVSSRRVGPGAMGTERSG